MGRADYYLDGSNNVICDMCGKKYKAHQLAKQWDGIWTCKRCWEPRQPQDFVRGVLDDSRPVLSRPEAPDEFTSGAQSLEPWDPTAPVGEPPVAAFSGNPLGDTVPFTVTFTNESTGSISSYLWNFGDESESTLENPTHEYIEAGEYTVSLTVTGPGGSDTETKTNYIVAEAPVPELDNIATFTSTGLPTATTAIYIGPNFSNYVAFILTTTAVRTALVLAGAIAYDLTQTLSPEGEFQASQNGTTIYFFRNGVEIANTANVLSGTLTLLLSSPSAPNTLTNITIG